MTNLVDPASVQEIVGCARHATAHYARWIFLEDRVVILHSQACLTAHARLGRDLTACSFSRALDKGVEIESWRLHTDSPERVAIRGGRLARVPDPERPAPSAPEPVPWPPRAPAAVSMSTPPERPTPREDKSVHRAVPFGANRYGNCPSCLKPIRPSGECACSD